MSAALYDGGPVVVTAVDPKTLPHSEESERAVLAAVLLDPERHLAPTAGRLEAEDFYFEKHQRLFQGMIELQEGGSSIDLRTMQALLEQRGELELVGGISYLATLDLDLPDLSRIESYVEIVKERSLRRRLIEASIETYQNCLDGGLVAEQALDQISQSVLELSKEQNAGGFVPIQDLLRDAVVELEERPDEPFPALTTGFTGLDGLIHGMGAGHLIVLAGRPGMGKTSFALNIAQHVAIRLHKGVGIFSLEMSRKELALRVLCSEADVPSSDLREGRISGPDWSRMLDTVRRIGDAPLWIDDGGNPSLLEITSKARQLRQEGRLDLLIIDYLQLMNAGGRYENRNLEISAISRGLKQLGKDLEIPIMALSQLSRQTERRGSDHRPQLADLRESGAIEQDADMVAFVYRDEVYHPDEPDNKGLAELILSKNRHGATGVVELAFLGETTSFRNLERYAEAPPGWDDGAPEPEPPF